VSTSVASIATPLVDTVRDVIPIAAILLFFQLVVLRRRIAEPRRVIVGLACVVAGLTLFIVGLEEALFPIGRTMAAQLTDPSFVGGSDGGIVWWDYYWVYAFAAAIGFASTIAEPALIAVSLKAEEASGGTIRPFHLRIAVAVGVAVSIALGALRIVTGIPLELFMIAGYAVVITQTVVGPRQIVPLAYDSGGVTTSTVTVPLVTALGLGLASTVPGRSPLLDGFGMIALAALFAVIAVLGYAQLAELQSRRGRRRAR
jgi:Protein of unknown function (DUF1538)